MANVLLLIGVDDSLLAWDRDPDLAVHAARACPGFGWSTPPRRPVGDLP
jgi:hypothetical protein